MTLARHQAHRGGRWWHAMASARHSTPASRSPRLPAELAGAVMLQPSHDGRDSSLLAEGPGLEDACHLGVPARPGGHLLRGGPGAGAGLDLEDVAGSRVVGRADRPGPRERRLPALMPMSSASWRATRIASTCRACSMIRSSGGTGSPWADSSPTALSIRPGRRDARRMGTLEVGEDRAGSGSTAAVPLPGRCPDRPRGLGPSAGGRGPSASRHGLPRPGRRPGRSWQRTDQLGSFLPAGRAGVRPPAGDAVRREPRVPGRRPAAVPGLLRAAAQRAAGSTPT